MTEKKPNKKKEKKANGRPTIYTQELADAMCEQLCEGVSLRTVCLPASMPSKATVFRWFRDKDGFRDQYDRAKEESADLHAEDIIDVAEDESLDVNRARLIVDAKKWTASKLKPKRYGDRQEVEHTGEGISFNVNYKSDKE